MRRSSAMLAAMFLSGCAVTKTVQPIDEGLPLDVPPAPPRAEHAAADPPILPRMRCGELEMDLPSKMREPFGAVVTRAMESAKAPASAAICACARGDEAHFLFVVSPDQGKLSIRSSERDAEIDACLAAHLAAPAFPSFHFGSDCIHCGPQRFGLFPGNPPADADPPDGYASVGFPVVARVRATE